MNIGVMLAAGMGSRYGTEIPKQYVMVRGRELIYYNIDAFKKSKLLDDYIVMVNEKVHISKKIETYYDVKTIVGGATRNESIGKALDWIKENYGGKEPINVFINDVASSIIDDSAQKCKCKICLPRRVGRAKSFLQKNWQNLLTNAPQMAIIISVA